MILKFKEDRLMEKNVTSGSSITHRTGIESLHIHNWNIGEKSFFHVENSKFVKFIKNPTILN